MRALLVIDIQNDFLPGGALGVPGGDAIVPIVNELMPFYDFVVATRDWHPENHGSFAIPHEGSSVGDAIDLNGLEQIVWPVHAVAGTAGAAFAPGLRGDRFDGVFEKGTDPGIDSYSGFFDNGHRHDTGLAGWLRERKVEEVHVVGLATDFCVKFTALEAVAEGFRTVLIEDATRGVNRVSGDVTRALDEMRSAGVEIVRSDEILGDTVTLYRPVGPEEFRLLEKAGFAAWPPRLPEQPIFYPVTNEAYAVQIAVEWNLPASGSAWVTRFRVRRGFLRSYPRRIVGGREHEELWIPAEDLEALNQNLDGPIEVVRELKPSLK
ncbi:MAG: bifunctional nicotinamidase/pyrazinamidase [Verrucomicrobiae bacterium]|nr:bifunctional nicotinamidase/pyrazinamidase [Verrucomicrobiae bacterium]MCP5551012.1 bifunctional nicotinamidase/pyrazinamidase [Akkermansiaceae bacterium]